MPRGDRTGPTGMGPRTGRGLGFCAGYEEPGYASPAYGFGRRGGRGAGRGRGAGFGRGAGRGWSVANYGPAGWGTVVPTTPAMSKEDEISWLESQARGLQDSLEQLQKRLDALKG